MDRKKLRRFFKGYYEREGRINVLGLITTVLDTLIKLAIIAFIIVVTLRFAQQAYDFGYRLFSEAPPSDPPGVEIEVTIPIGASSRDIGRILEERGVIRDANIFFLQELMSDYRGKLTPGTYTLNNSWTADQIMAAMSSSDISTEETAGGQASGGQQAETAAAAQDNAAQEETPSDEEAAE